MELTIIAIYTIIDNLYFQSDITLIRKQKCLMLKS